MGGEAIDRKATTRRVRGSAPLQLSAFGVLGASTGRMPKVLRPLHPQENCVKAKLPNGDGEVCDDLPPEPPRKSTSGVPGLRSTAPGPQVRTALPYAPTVLEQMLGTCGG